MCDISGIWSTWQYVFYLETYRWDTNNTQYYSCLLRPFFTHNNFHRSVILFLIWFGGEQISQCRPFLESRKVPFLLSFLCFRSINFIPTKFYFCYLFLCLSTIELRYPNINWREDIKQSYYWQKKLKTNKSVLGPYSSLENWKICS